MLTGFISKIGIVSEVTPPGIIESARPTLMGIPFESMASTSISSVPPIV
jgi:hypothetical protein